MWELDSERNSSSLQEHMPRAEETGDRKSRNVRQDASSMGREHSDTLTSAHNLALVLRDQGKYEEAELMSRRVLEWHEKVIGMGHRDTLTISSNLALVL